MKSKIIGIAYKARQGKSYLANEMHKLAPERIKLYGFADALKQYCLANHDELVKQHPDKVAPPKKDPIYGYTGILQAVGSTKRLEDVDYWLKQVAQKIETEEPEVAVIADVRYENEANWVIDNGGFMLRIRRIMPDGTQFIDPSRDANHPSEIALDSFEKWDCMLDCLDGKLDALQQSASLLVQSILELDDRILLQH